MKILLVLSVILAAAVVHADHAGTCPDNLAPTCKCADGTVVPSRSRRDADKKPCPKGRPTCLCTDGSTPVKPKGGDGHEEDAHKSPCADGADPQCSGWFQTFINIIFLIFIRYVP